MRWTAGDRMGHEEAVMHLVAWLGRFREEREPVAIGHRVVHGGEADLGALAVGQGGRGVAPRLVQ